MASIEKDEQCGKKENMKRREETTGRENVEERKKRKKNQRKQCHSSSKTKICLNLSLYLLKLILPEKMKVSPA